MRHGGRPASSYDDGQSQDIQGGLGSGKKNVPRASFADLCGARGVGSMSVAGAANRCTHALTLKHSNTCSAWQLCGLRYLR